MKLPKPFSLIALNTPLTTDAIYYSSSASPSSSPPLSLSLPLRSPWRSETLAAFVALFPFLFFPILLLLFFLTVFLVWAVFVMVWIGPDRFYNLGPSISWPTLLCFSCGLKCSVQMARKTGRINSFGLQWPILNFLS